MKAVMTHRFARLWRLPILVSFLTFSLTLQADIVYVHAPLTNPNNDPGYLGWDSLGKQVGPDFSITISNQTVLTFYTVNPGGQPTAFAVQAGTGSSVIGQQPVDETFWCVAVPAGTTVDSNAVGSTWCDSGIFSATAPEESSASLGNFLGLDPGYLGFRFQVDEQTYYGWARVACPLYGLNVGWVYDYAYETTPDLGINAGQTNYPAPVETTQFSANISGNNVFPPAPSPHDTVGSFTLESSSDGQYLTYHIEFSSDFQPSSVVIYDWEALLHNRPALIADLGLGHQGSVFGEDLALHTIRVFEGRLALTTNQVAQLLASRWFVNFSTDLKPLGEIRGTIFPTAPKYYTATLTGAGERPKNSSAYSGQASFTLSAYHLTPYVYLDSDLPVDSLSLYRPPFFWPGPANRVYAFDMTYPYWVFSEGRGMQRYFGDVDIVLTDFQVFLLQNDGLFLNATTPSYPNGEIGGHILPVVSQTTEVRPAATTSGSPIVKSSVSTSSPAQALAPTPLSSAAPAQTSQPISAGGGQAAVRTQVISSGWQPIPQTAPARMAATEADPDYQVFSTTATDNDGSTDEEPAQTGETSKTDDTTDASQPEPTDTDRDVE